MHYTFPELQQYVDNYQQHIYLKTGHYPLAMATTDRYSPCIIEKNQEAVYWKMVIREDADFSPIERGIELILHEDVKAYYGALFSGDIPVIYKGLQMQLIQIWNEADFLKLSENILGHLVMQRRLKLAPTIFIAALRKENEIISIDNETGEVLYEFLGTGKRIVLAKSLSDLLPKLSYNAPIYFKG